jgi:cell wall-associated NlpC family hydrolase
VTDRRLLPSNGRVALESLRDSVAADRYLAGEWQRVTAALTDICAAPNGQRDRQVPMGTRVLVLEVRDGWAFCQAERDGYVGYVAAAALGPDAAATHWVAAPATHLYPAPAMKQREVAALTLGARLTVTGTEGQFLRTDAGQFAPVQHLRALGDWFEDPVAVAESLLGTPYLWGGDSRSGIDCSGLVQAAHLACGIPCPADSDLQAAGFGDPLPHDAPLQRGDLLFWKGHVALVAGPDRIIHANAHHMAVAYEGTEDAIRRIRDGSYGEVIARRRPPRRA